MPNIFLGVSSHGYGHLSQIIPIANQLLKLDPTSKFFIQCVLPTKVITERLNTKNFVHIPTSLDIGLIQPNPLDVDIDSTFLAYKAFHENYDEKADELAKFFIKSQIEIVIADIPYLAIEAANRASIPVIAVASLTWDKVIESYFDNNKEAQSIINQIIETQSKCSLALHPAPSMHLDSFTRSQSIPPIVLEGTRIIDLRERLGIANTDKRKIVLVSLGGIESPDIPIEALFNDKRFHWLVNVELTTTTENVHSAFSIQGCLYRDLVASVDAMVSKPGYGTASEVVNYQLPFLFTCRGDFPDEPYIVNWLESHSRSKEISKNEWLSGSFGNHLIKLIQEPQNTQIKCNGAEVAAKIIHENFLLH